MASDRLSLARAAEVSGLPVEALYGLIVRGQLKAERDEDSGVWVIAPDELRRYVEGLPHG